MLNNLWRSNKKEAGKKKPGMFYHAGLPLGFKRLKMVGA